MHRFSKEIYSTKYIHTVDGRRQKEKSVQRCFFSLSPTDNASSSTSSATTTTISYLHFSFLKNRCVYVATLRRLRYCRFDLLLRFEAMSAIAIATRMSVWRSSPKTMMVANPSSVKCCGPKSEQNSVKMTWSTKISRPGIFMFDVSLISLDTRIFRETTTSNDFPKSSISDLSVINFQKPTTLDNISDVALTKRRQSSICSGKISVL